MIEKSTRLICSCIPNAGVRSFFVTNKPRVVLLLFCTTWTYSKVECWRFGRHESQLRRQTIAGPKLSRSERLCRARTALPMSALAVEHVIAQNQSKSEILKTQLEKIPNTVEKVMVKFETISLLNELSLSKPYYIIEWSFYYWIILNTTHCSTCSTSLY